VEFINSLSEGATSAIKWLNDNQGLVSVIIWGAALLLGWTSGIFSALRQKPRLRIRLLPGPTFSCTFPTGRNHEGWPGHITAIALYLSIGNVGSKPTAISDVHVAYRHSMKWSFNFTQWKWLDYQVAALNDFTARIGGNLKVYPFLTQRNFLSPEESDSFLPVGRQANGVVYFEQKEHWGGFFPHQNAGGTVCLKVCVYDVYGKRYVKRVTVPNVDLEYARTYSPTFGSTFEEMHSGRQEPRAEPVGDALPETAEARPEPPG
jgi:hypothetical protein